MTAKYDSITQSYTVELSAQEAHILIWGGKFEEIAAAENALREALLKAEDEQMSDDDYVKLFQS